MLGVIPYHLLLQQSENCVVRHLLERAHGHIGHVWSVQGKNAMQPSRLDTTYCLFPAYQGVMEDQTLDLCSLSWLFGMSGVVWLHIQPLR